MTYTIGGHRVIYALYCLAAIALLLYTIGAPSEIS
jgi:hypothetical protein